MKTRVGFVSNSSSSSFCIYGVAFKDFDAVLSALKSNTKISDEEIYMFINGKFKDVNVVDEESFVRFCKSYGEGAIIDTLLSVLDTSSHNSDLCCFIGGEYNESLVSIGHSWTSIDDNETGLMFKTKIHNSIEVLFGAKKSAECSTIEESFYNG